MTTLSLNGNWSLAYFPERQYRPNSPSEFKALNLPSIPAVVPGNVELDLVRAGKLSDPFFADNIRKLRPFENYEWWYSLTFKGPEITSGEHWDLIFEGLDTLATVWLNGIKIGSSDNMLVEQRFDATSALQPGAENELVVRLGSALQQARRYEYDAVDRSWENREESLYIRKPAHSYGWDILPRAVTAGIWRPVRLESVPDTAIEQLYVYTQRATPECARLGVRYQFRTPERDLATPESHFSIRVSGVCKSHTGERRFEHVQPVEFIAGGFSFDVTNPALWWPKGCGEPALYSLRTEVLHNDQVVASRTDHIGIRKLSVERTELAGRPFMPEPADSDTVRIDTAPDPESHFLFRVNGEPIQVRGTNWVPLDAFHSRDDGRVDKAVALVDDLGCNMIRCWGGGVYESDRFFDLCDQNGILVWQDFAFACNRYPQTSDFLDRVRLEAQSVVKRLRNHACLAVWCGDNEIDMTYLTEGISPENNHITRQVIPDVLHRCDPYRAYVPSSPYAPPAVFQQHDPWRATPEQHLWGPRNYFKSPFYVGHSAHFIGEMGYHGCPNVDSIRRFISPEQVWPEPGHWKNNPEWRTHDTYHWNPSPDGSYPVDRDRIKLMANQIKELFGAIPEDLESFVLASQISQAEADKFFIESTRARKWATSGVLWWNVLDGWPQFSDAVVDYYFSKKLAYHYIWRSQRPVLLMLGEPGSGKYLPLIGCNDTLQPACGRYSVRESGGDVVAEGEFTLPPNQNWQLARIRTYTSDQRLYLIDWKLDEHCFGNHYVSGRPPFSLAQYRIWLDQIAVLPRAFEI